MQIYADICKIYAIICISPTRMDLKRKNAKKMQELCIYMQNMQA